MQFIKNITSKDLALSKKTISDLIKTTDIEKFRLLAEKADFIFPFLKDRIIKDFVKLVNKNDLNSIFAFTKVYSFDFEEMIIKSFLKFADEDLTDRILNLFQNGTKEQKAYCAKYFSYINDFAALDLLYENYNCDFEPLKINCILALKAFNDKKTAALAKENILNFDDEFKKLDDYEILSIFNEIDFIIKNSLNSPLNFHIISLLLNYNDFNSIKNAVSIEEIKRILNILIENYPENISLDTILYYQIYDFIKLISEFKDSYSKNILLYSKAKFEEFLINDIYTFDFDKSIKQEIKNIFEFLNSLDLKVDDVIFGYNFEKTYQFNLLLDIIEEYNIKKFDNDLVKIFNNNDIEYDYLARIAAILKSHGKLKLINNDVVQKIENENVKGLILSYL